MTSTEMEQQRHRHLTHFHPCRCLVPSKSCPLRCAQIWRIYVYCEDDVSVLHVLECREDDYDGLKRRHGLRVDHAAFPGKLIRLLERCIGSAAPDAR